jgi:6-phosphogluconolactonase
MRTLNSFTAAAVLASATVRVLAAGASGELVYVGTDPTIGMGSVQGATPVTADAPQGLFGARLDAQSGHLTSLGLQMPLPRATWQVADPATAILYTVADSGGGIATESMLYSLAVDRATGALKMLNRTGAGGRDATYLALDSASRTLLVANHASGDVTSFALLSNGGIGAMASDQKTSGTGPHRRQGMPQPHSVAVDPAGGHVIAAEFGGDRLYIYRFDRPNHTLTPAPTPFESLPAGSGPRHLAFHPSGRFLFLNTELTAQVRVYRWDVAAERLTPLQTVSAYPVNYAGAQEPSSSELGLSRDGRFLYLSLRGDQNSIVAYAVNARTGKLTEVQRVPSQGLTPRSFCIDPTGRWMLVMNQASDSVNLFAIGQRDGKLTPTKEGLSIPRPVSGAFVGR